jgi:hypothetical protein
MRRELLDLCRHYFGPHGVAANHESARIDGKMGVSCICLVFVESGKARLAASAEEGATVMRE